MKIKTKIPISREILVDMETPLSVYRKLANGPYSYLFESVEGGENWARYSLIGLEASQIIFLNKNQIEIELNGKIIERSKETINKDLKTGEIDRNLAALSTNNIKGYKTPYNIHMRAITRDGDVINKNNISQYNLLDFVQPDIKELCV